MARVNTPANFVQMYAEHAKLQANRGRKLLELAAPERGEVVLDIGCGTGHLTHALAQHVGPQGRVHAIDPDPERLAYAQASTPEGIDNIQFIGTTADQLGAIEDASIDLMFSNYVFQWIEDKPAALREILRVLRPGGRAVMEVVGKIIDFQNETSALAGEAGLALTRKFFCPDRDEWVVLLEQAGFEVVRADWPVLDFDYPDLDTFFEWWEGTTHGMFQRSAISEDGMAQLRRDYPGRIYYQRNAFVGVARRPAG